MKSNKARILIFHWVRHRNRKAPYIFGGVGERDSSLYILFPQGIHREPGVINPQNWEKGPNAPFHLHGMYGMDFPFCFPLCREDYENQFPVII